MTRTPKKTPQKGSKKQTTNTVGAYAVQCGKCLKWRLVSTREEYETIRHNFIEDPWFCSRNPYVSCDDPADLEYDTSRFWVIDKPNIPKPPEGLERNLVMRSDYSKMDVHYVMPNGRRARCPAEVEKFLAANPKFRGKISASDFNFTVPKILEDMQPRKPVRGSASGGKRAERVKDEDDDNNEGGDEDE